MIAVVEVEVLGRRDTPHGPRLVVCWPRELALEDFVGPRADRVIGEAAERVGKR